MTRFAFQADLWLYPGDAGWHFVTLPTDVSDEIADLPRSSRRGFGSVPVEVTVGATTWQTSIFPDTKAGAYVLPVKKRVRLAEGLEDGETVDVVIEIRGVRED